MPAWKTRQASPGAVPQAVLFLDRDGVVIRDADYLADPAEVEILPGVADALHRARAAGYLLVGVSNQSGIARGYFTVADFQAVMTRLSTELAVSGADFDGFFYCPHGPADDCPCRKPRIGLLDEAAAAFAWDPARSWVIGDKSSDVELARNADLGAVLVRTGYGSAEAAKVAARWADDQRVLIAADLPAAVELILSGVAGGTGEVSS